jgi:penicillin-binding protein 2
MVGAVTRGTASPFLVKPLRYPLAGKTGTAQVFTIKQTDSTRAKIQDERHRDHAWFIAFAPVDDPKIAVAVLVENGGFGGQTAAPIAQKVIDAFLLGADPPADPKKPTVPDALGANDPPIAPTAVPAHAQTSAASGPAKL